MKMALIMNFLLFSSNHPISIMFIIIIMSILMMMLMIFIMKLSWLSFLLILMMLGGMVILFMYIASISPNKIMVNFSFLMTIPMFLLIPSNTSTFYNFTCNKFMYQIFMSFSCYNSIFLISYLLMALYFILKLINSINMTFISN